MKKTTFGLIVAFLSLHSAFAAGRTVVGRASQIECENGKAALQLSTCDDEGAVFTVIQSTPNDPISRAYAPIYNVVVNPKAHPANIGDGDLVQVKLDQDVIYLDGRVLKSAE